VLDLERGVFAEYESETDRVFAQAFGRTEHAPKANPFRSTFCINRAGKNLSADRRRKLERAKGELCRLFHHGILGSW
jgi:hypothetical protein